MSDTTQAAVDHSAPSENQTYGANNGGEPETLIIGGVDVEDAMFLGKRKVQQFLDRIAFYPGKRWAAFFIMLSFFLLRMYQ